MILWDEAFMNRPEDDNNTDPEQWFKNGFDVINDFRQAIRVDMELDHEWSDDTLGGFHKQVSLHAQEDPDVESGHKMLSKEHPMSEVPEVRIKNVNHICDLAAAGAMHYPTVILRNSDAHSSGYVDFDDLVYCHEDFEMGEFTIESVTFNTIKSKKVGIFLFGIKTEDPVTISTITCHVRDEYFQGYLYPIKNNYTGYFDVQFFGGLQADQGVCLYIVGSVPAGKMQFFATRIQ